MYARCEIEALPNDGIDFSAVADKLAQVRKLVAASMAMRTFTTCTVCGSPIMVNENGVAYCPSCDSSEK